MSDKGGIDEFDEEEVEALPEQRHPEFASVRLSEFISMDLGNLKIQRVIPPTGKRRRSGGGEGGELLRAQMTSDTDPSLPSLPENDAFESDDGTGPAPLKRTESESSFGEGLDSDFHWQRHRDSIKVLKVFETASAQTTYRTIIFIRSGKSAWSDQRTGFMHKIRGLMDSRNDENKPNLDAPLSKKGVIQAKNFSKFMRLQKLEDAHRHVEALRESLIEQLQEAVESLKSKDPGSEEFAAGREKLRQVMKQLQRFNENILRGDQPPLRPNFTPPEVFHTLLFDHQQCVITASNLQRSLQTASIALEERFKFTEEEPRDDPLVVLSCLQEISPNSHVDNQPQVVVPLPDTSPILSPLMVECDNDFDKEELGRKEQDYVRRVDNFYNNGDVGNMDKTQRIKEYLSWVFEKNEKQTVVSFGHGRWFREFFQEIIPPQPNPKENEKDGEDPEVSKKKRLAFNLRKKKIQDCSVIAFSLYKYVRPNGTEPIYSLPIPSLDLIYGQLARN